MTHHRPAMLAMAISLIVLGPARPAVAQTPEVATSVAFTEGPAVDRDGNVYFTELVGQRIMKLSAKGLLSTFRERSNNANGLLIDPQGRLVACEGAESARTGELIKHKPQVTRTDLRTGKMEVLADNYQGKPFVGPNDVTIDSKGRLYFTDLPGGAVYRIDGPGHLARILAAPEVQRPNGIQISPDDKQLYLIEANQAEGGARMIRAYDLRPDGTVAQHARPLQLLSGPQRGRHEHRYAGKSVRVSRDEPASWDLGNPREQGRRVCDLPAGQAPQIHPDRRGLHHEQRLRRAGHEDALCHRREEPVPDQNGYRGTAAIAAYCPAIGSTVPRPAIRPMRVYSSRYRWVYQGTGCAKGRDGGNV